MAEIKIEEKKTAVWPWVLLGILLLGLLLYFLLRNNDNADDTAQIMQNTTSQAALQDTNATATYDSGALTEYVSYVNGTQAMGLDHVYTSGAFMRLAGAIEAKAQQAGYDVKADVDRVREMANKIEKDPMETTHANSIREAADVASTAMMNLQQAKFPNLGNDAQMVMQKVKNIDPGTLTLNQKEAVKTFFDQSADLLQKMN